MVNFIIKYDAVAMGSSLAPVFANIFMGFYKSKWLNEYNLNKPKFYDMLMKFQQLLTRNRIH